MSNSVLFWYLAISFNAAIPGLARFFGARGPTWVFLGAGLPRGFRVDIVAAVAVDVEGVAVVAVDVAEAAVVTVVVAVVAVAVVLALFRGRFSGIGSLFFLKASCWS